MKFFVFFFLNFSIFLSFSESVYGMSCPTASSSIKGSVNPTLNPEEFYKILLNDISMGVVLRGIEQGMQSGDYHVIKEETTAEVIMKSQKDNQFSSTFTLTRVLAKLKPNSSLGHNIHMPNLIITGEIRVDSQDQVEACIGSIEIQNTEFGHL